MLGFANQPQLSVLPTIVVVPTHCTFLRSDSSMAEDNNSNELVSQAVGAIQSMMDHVINGHTDEEGTFQLMDEQVEHWGTSKCPSGV